MNKITWTQELDDRLRELAAKNNSTRMIAIEMGISRNAACGRMWRIGISPTGGSKVAVRHERRQIEEMLPGLAALGLTRQEVADELTRRLGFEVPFSRVKWIAGEIGVSFAPVSPPTKKSVATRQETKRPEKAAVKRARKPRAQPAVATEPVNIVPVPEPVAKATASVPKSGGDRSFFARLLNEAPLPSTSRRVALPEIPGRNQCRFIVGDPREPGAFWCGDAVSGASSYCPCHRVITSASSLPSERALAREMLERVDGQGNATAAA
jgi:hypothetical protein